MNQNRIREKIRQIKLHSKEIEDNMPENFEDFQEMGLAKDGVYKKTELMIQESYDICSIISKEGELRVPGDEESIPDILAEKDILKEDTAEKLKDMKGFRNALAHKYGSINDKKAYKNIKNGLQDFKQFLEEIETYLD